jgi:hypothetical protein
MQLTIAQAHELVSSHGVFARECCDKCGRLLGAVRFTRQGEAGEWCSRECRGDGARVVIRRGGPRKYRNVEERRAAKTRQQKDYRQVAVWKKPSCSLIATNHLQA